jgi:hypothetical protein
MGDMTDYVMSTVEFTKASRNILKICRYCGTGALHWEMVDDKYRLHYKDGREHYCMGGVVVVLPPKRKRI